MRLLETAGIKLASVMSDVLGISGRLMFRALIEGTATAEQMANLARRSLRKKIALLASALEGRLEEHHRFLLNIRLEQVERLEEDLRILDARIEQKPDPYREQHRRLTQIPAVDWVVAATIIAELGVDMSVFPSVGHAAAWTGVCPGNNESAGKTKAQHVRRGNVHLQSALVQAAMCASRTKGGCLKEKFWRLAAKHRKTAVLESFALLYAVEIRR